MSNVDNAKQCLHWSQRVALVRHSLHAASRSGDFTFFKTLQAMGLMEETNHVATLTNQIGDDADTVLAAMDNLNAGLAYVHQDAFKNVYDNLKDSMRGENKEADTSKLYVDIAMQKNMADMAIDKMASFAIALITQQPAEAQDTATSIWITGITIVADAMAIALQELSFIDDKMQDFIRMEESWNNVKAAVVASITGLKGVFSLMDVSNPPTPCGSQRSASIASASSAVFRRLSNAFAGQSGPGSAGSHSRTASVASANGITGLNSNLANFNRNGSVSSVKSNPVYRTPNYVRNSVSTGCPISMPAGGDWQSHKLSAILPTPAQEELMDPFDMSTAPDVPPVPQLPEIAVLVPDARAEGTEPTQRRMSMMVN